MSVRHAFIALALVTGCGPRVVAPGDEAGTSDGGTRGPTTTGVTTGASASGGCPAEGLLDCRVLLADGSCSDQRVQPNCVDMWWQCPADALRVEECPDVPPDTGCFGIVFECVAGPIDACGDIAMEACNNCPEGWVSPGQCRCFALDQPRCFELSEGTCVGGPIDADCGRDGWACPPGFQRHDECFFGGSTEGSGTSTSGSTGSTA